MNRVKRFKNDNYTTISNVFLKDDNLSIKAKGFLAVVMGLPENWDFSIRGICSILQEGKTAVYNVIEELRQKGYCLYEVVRDGKGLVVGTDYSFAEEPIYEKEITLRMKRKRDTLNIDNLNSENQETESLEMDSETQLNTKLNKKLNEEKKEEIKEGTIVPKKEIGFKEIMDYWNANTVSFAKVRVASSKVKSSIKSRLKDGYSVDDIKKAIMLCETLPDFYKGKDKGKSWKADFTWLINNTNGNFDKIMTGALHVTSSANKAYQDIINGNISTYKDEYRPTLDGFNMMWSDNVGCYVTTYELNSMMFVDGYKDSERPECAVVMVQGTRYRWNKDANKWVRV